MRAKLLLALAVSVLLVIWTEASSAQPTRTPFDRWDRDGDGRVTKADVPEGVVRAFDHVDTNGDGVITRQEDAAFRAARRTPRRPLVEKIEIRRNVAYADTDNPRQRLDLYLPKERASDDPLPLVAWIHGGAWLAGSKDNGINNLRELVASGQYVGASIGYRLSPEATWPAQIHDCKAAIRWLRGHAEELGIDPERIGVWGASAGGHLVAMLGTSGDVRALEGDLGGYDETSSRVTCVVDYFGPANMQTMGDAPSTMDHNAPDSPESRLIGAPILEREDLAKAASPITYVSDDDPPILIVHGDRDMTVPYAQSQEFETALERAGIDVTLLTVDGAGHGGFRNPEVARRVRAFFDRHLRGLDVQCEGGVLEQ